MGKNKKNRFFDENNSNESNKSEEMNLLVIRLVLLGELAIAGYCLYHAFFKAWLS